MQRYEVILVSPKEYHGVAKSDPRYENAIDAMGFADVTKNKAWVKSTHWPELNKYLINHEFSHLMEDHATDEDEHGIRLKKGFKDVFRNIGAVSLAPFSGGQSLRLLTDPGKEAIRDAVPKEVTDLGPQIGGGLGFALGGPIGAAAGAGLGSVGKQLLEQPDPNRSLMSRITGSAPKNALAAFGIGSGLQALGGLPGIPQTSGAITTATRGVAGSPAPAGPSVTNFRGSPSSSFSSKAPGSIGRSRLQFGQLPPELTGAAPTQTALGTQLGSPMASFSPPSSFAPIAQNFASGLGTGLGQSAMEAFQTPRLSSQAVGISAPPQQQALAPAVQQQVAQEAGQQVAQQPNFSDIISKGVQGIQKNLGLGSALAIGGGLGLAGFAEKGGPQTPEVPNFREIPSIQQLSGIANAEGVTRGSASPLGDLARTRLSEQLTGQYGGLSPEVQGGIKRQFDDLRRQVASQFKMFRPAADLESDSAFRQAMTEVSQREAETIANFQLQQQNIFEQTRRQDIATALGVDEQTLAQLTNLAQLDITQIMTQLGLDAAEATRFKQTFGQLGGTIAGLGVAGALGAFKQPQPSDTSSTQ